MDKKARKRKKEQLKEWMGQKREWNKAHPVEVQAREEVFQAQRLLRIKKREGVDKMKVERRRLKHERYLKRREKRESERPLTKRLARWLGIGGKEKKNA